MSQRLEAAVKAWDHHWGDRYGDEALEEMGEEVQVALDAADAVMFSEAGDKLVADTLHAHRQGALTCYDHDTGWCCVCGTHEIRVTWFEHAARAVTKALKGAARV